MKKLKNFKEFVNEASNNEGLYYEAAKKVLKAEKVRLHPARIEALLNKLKSDGHLAYDEMYMKKAEEDIKNAISKVEIKTYMYESVNEGYGHKSGSMFDSQEQEDVRMIQAKWSNAVLAQDAKGMEKYMKELVKANDAYIKKIKSEK